MSTVGGRFKGLRESIGLSQVKLAHIAGLTQSTINRYEHNLAEPSFTILQWYADYFDVSLDYIFCRTDNPQGKLYDFKPHIPNEDLQQFIEMCFDPKSPMSDKLKQTLLRLMEEQSK